MDRVVLVILFAAIWISGVLLMYVGWRGRGRRQREMVGELPVVPEVRGEQTVPTATGLYLGTTIAPNWQDRIAIGDIGYRAAGTVTAYPTGVAVDRDGASTIWIPRPALRAIRTERGHANKVMTKDGILVIRWQLPSGLEVDTGFRADNKSVYPTWVDSPDLTAETTETGEAEAEGADSRQTKENT